MTAVDARQKLSSLMAKTYNYSSYEVAGLEELISFLKDNGFEKKIVKDILSDVSDDGMLNCNLKINVGSNDSSDKIFYSFCPDIAHASLFYAEYKPLNPTKVKEMVSTLTDDVYNN
jgi:hypothetical protein